MRIFKYLMIVLLAAVAASCSDVNGDLLKMIPADAAGVVSFDTKSILTKSTILNDGELAIPEQLKTIVDENDALPLNQLLTNLPVMGLNTDGNIYIFFTTKTFSEAIVMSLDDEDAARKIIEQTSGGDFAEVNGLQCIYREDVFYTIEDKVLLIGKVNMPMDINKPASAAKRMLDHTATSIADDKEVMECIGADNDMNAYLKVNGLKMVLNGSKAYQEIAQKIPLIEIFTESDVDAYIATMNLNDHDAKLDVKVKVADNSEYINLLSNTLSNPSADFLKAIPETMDYIVAMSVKGENFVKLSQINQLIEMFKKLPFIGNLDLQSMVATIDGPVAAGLAYDQYMEQWNVVVAAKSNNPDAVVETIAKFASSMGQNPEVYNNEYVYQYDNKMIVIGVKEGILYVKMLNYEQTEGYSYDNAEARSFFEKSPMGIYVRANNDGKGGSFQAGLTDMRSMSGAFLPTDKNGNASIALLNVLCGIKPVKPYDNLEPQESFLPDGIELKPVN